MGESVVIAEATAGKTIMDILKKIIPLLVLLIVMSIIIYVIYTMTGSVIQRAEHRKHVQEEQAMQSIEVLESTTQQLGNDVGVQVYTFQLKEGQKYRIDNLLLEYSFYDPETVKITVSVYCNDEAYDVWEFQPLSKDDTISYKISDCPDWTEKKVFNILITPKEFIKASLHNEKINRLREVIVKSYILEFQVKVVTVQQYGQEENLISSQINSKNGG